MRVIQTRNDIIRLIFNPKTDGLCLSDFLIVRDGQDNFLGQIIEIYDDKFNQEENVASIRLVYRILPDHQVVPYDNFTPSRECEIAKIKLEEIEKCLNTDKDTVPFGISTKNNKIVNINLNFFNNNPVIFADKLDEVNCAFENAAQKLKSFKKVVVIDYTGTLNIKNAKRIKAKTDFKLPLDFYSLEYIWQKATSRASLEAQAELEDMFVELQKFVSSTEDKYIPFPRFVKVIEQQYKVTPAIELKLFLNSLRRYWHEELFARSKREFQGIAKALQKESTVIIDLSNLRLEWHREFLEFAIRQVRDFDAYLLLRLNENNSNPEMINDLYLKNPKLNIISSISYGFVKLPHIMEYAKNYILYKTLNPRRDFGFANFQVAALNSSSFLMFGEDTRDFMFILKNYVFDEEEANKEEDKKVYIDLNLELEDMKPVELAGKNFELKNIHIQNTKKNRLKDEVALEDVFREAFDESQMPEDNNQEDIPNEAEPGEEEFQDIPLVIEDKNSLANTENDTASKGVHNELEAQLRAEIAETNEKLSASFDSLDEVSSENAEESLCSDDENKQRTDEEAEAQIENSKEEDEDVRAAREAHKDVSTVDAKRDSIEAISEVEQEEEQENSKMAELIEASLKNDEEYIKELSSDVEAIVPDEQANAFETIDAKASLGKNSETKSLDKTLKACENPSNIPLSEEDLDYFINPSDTEEVLLEDKTDNAIADEEVITTEMIENAAFQEQLASEMEAQADAEAHKETLLDNIKKNSSEEGDKQETSAVSATEAELIQTENEAKISEEHIEEKVEDFAATLHQIKEEAENILLSEEELEAESKEQESLLIDTDGSNPDMSDESVGTIIANGVSDETNLSTEEEPGDIVTESLVAKAEPEMLKEIANSADDKAPSVSKPTVSLDDSANEAELSEIIQTQKQEKNLLPDTIEETQGQTENKIDPMLVKEDFQSKTTANAVSQQDSIIIVKEKPNLLIEDFTEKVSNAEIIENEITLKEDAEEVSLKELAQKAIEARFDEVIDEAGKSAASKKNKLQINENVSIDLDKIKSNINETETSLPIFKNNDNETEDAEYDFQEGMRVSHEKYGEGNILKVVKYSNRCLLQIDFDNTGKRLLDPKIAKIKPM